MYKKLESTYFLSLTDFNKIRGLYIILNINFLFFVANFQTILMIIFCSREYFTKVIRFLTIDFDSQKFLFINGVIIINYFILTTYRSVSVSIGCKFLYDH